MSLSLSKHRSIPRLPPIHPSSNPNRSLSTSQARPSIQFRSQRYNPLFDPQLQIYLGKKSIKTKLLSMGYQLNPEQTKIIGKHPVKVKRPGKYEQKNFMGKREEEGIVKQISKTEFDVYIESMRRRVRQEE